MVGISIIFLLSDMPTRLLLRQWLSASASNVFERGRVWTLVTSPLLEQDFAALLLSVLMMWMFIPTLERFWGTTRFYRFVAITSIAGTLAGSLCGLLIGGDDWIVGLSPFIAAAFVAFGIVYARQPVQFFGVLPLTGRQMMFGYMGFLVLYVVLQQYWERGAAFGAAMLAAAVMTSKRWSPGLAWRRWRIARARARLSVLEGGKPPPKRDEQRWLN